MFYATLMLLVIHGSCRRLLLECGGCALVVAGALRHSLMIIGCDWCPRVHVGVASSDTTGDLSDFTGELGT